MTDSNRKRLLIESMIISISLLISLHFSDCGWETCDSGSLQCQGDKIAYCAADQSDFEAAKAAFERDGFLEQEVDYGDFTMSFYGDGTWKTVVDCRDSDLVCVEEPWFGPGTYGYYCGTEKGF